MSCRFSADGAKRISATTTRLERAYRNPAQIAALARSAPWLPLHAKTILAILAATSSTQMRSAVVRLMLCDDAGTLTDSGDDITVWHKATSGGVAANKPIMIDPAQGGYVIRYVEC